MMIVLISMFFLMFNMNMFSGIYMYLVMFIFFLFNFSILGSEMFKGELLSLFGLDYISFYLILLLFWLCSLILILFYNFFLSIMIMVILFSMLGVFLSMNFMYMFICFEFSMLPMFLIIMFFGMFKERYSASLYMMTYTMVSSLSFLVIIMMIMNWSGSLCIDYMMFNYNHIDLWLELVIIIMFLVKIPMFVLHIWLPKAHVEAPVYGSMILASVMLKMGGYGIIRCMDFMNINIDISDFFFCLCLCGGVMISYICLSYGDLKILVAYSSIIHMGMMLVGFFSGTEMGYLGGIIMMLSHGLCSSGMFYLVNEIYKVSGSRLLIYNKGCFSSMPILMWLWLILLMNNMGVPPCFGILSELMLITSCLMYSYLMFFMVFIMVFFISCFVMNMYIMMVNGLFMFKSVNVQLMTYYGCMNHLIPLNFFIFFFSTCF